MMGVLGKAATPVKRVRILPNGFFGRRPQCQLSVERTAAVREALDLRSDNQQVCDAGRGPLAGPVIGRTLADARGESQRELVAFFRREADAKPIHGV